HPHLAVGDLPGRAGVLPLHARRQLARLEGPGLIGEMLAAFGFAVECASDANRRGSYAGPSDPCFSYPPIGCTGNGSTDPSGWSGDAGDELVVHRRSCHAGPETVTVNEFEGSGGGGPGRAAISSTGKPMLDVSTRITWHVLSRARRVEAGDPRRP